MTKRNAFYACGAAVLAIASFVSTHASKKYTATLTAYFKNVTAAVTIFKGISLPAGSIQHLTTVANATHTAFFRTASGVDHTMYANNSLTTKLYYK